MEKCERCGHLKTFCDGVVTLGTDPFAEEIHDDYTEYWMCSGERYESAMDI